MSDFTELAFVLTEASSEPAGPAVVAGAAKRDTTLTPADGDTGLSFTMPDGGWVAVMNMQAPHPEALDMATAVTSPERAAVERSQSHLVIALRTSHGNVRERDTMLAGVTAAVIQAMPDATAAKFGHGAVFHRADVFLNATETAGLPVMIAVDVTTAPEPGDRISFLTHGLERYGREEFFVTASQHGQGAIEYLYGLINWMLDDPDKVLPTGDTVGRTADEKITVQRVASPIPDRPQVIRLDMDMDDRDMDDTAEPSAAPAKPKRRGFFRK